jgi:hypothetical protein
MHMYLSIFIYHWLIILTASDVEDEIHYCWLFQRETVHEFRCDCLCFRYTTELSITVALGLILWFHSKYYSVSVLRIRNCYSNFRFMLLLMNFLNPLLLNMSFIYESVSESDGQAEVKYLAQLSSWFGMLLCVSYKLSMNSRYNN